MTLHTEESQPHDDSSAIKEKLEKSMLLFAAEILFLHTTNDLAIDVNTFINDMTKYRVDNAREDLLYIFDSIDNSMDTSSDKKPLIAAVGAFIKDPENQNNLYDMIKLLRNHIDTDSAVYSRYNTYISAKMQYEKQYPSKIILSRINSLLHIAPALNEQEKKTFDRFTENIKNLEDPSKMHSQISIIEISMRKITTTELKNKVITLMENHNNSIDPPTTTPRL